MGDAEVHCLEQRLAPLRHPRAGRGELAAQGMLAAADRDPCRQIHGSPALRSKQTAVKILDRTLTILMGRQ